MRLAALVAAVAAAVDLLVLGCFMSSRRKWSQ
jgi:hypothetical protein